MFKLLFALHVLTAVFAIGPLVHAATTASRGVRTGDGAATASASRVLKIYSYASVLVLVFGFALMSTTSTYTHKKTGDFSDTYIWLSALLWLVAMGIVLAVLVPTLEKVTEAIGKQESVVTNTGKVAASGGVVGLIFAVVIFLMVYQPGR